MRNLFFVVMGILLATALLAGLFWKPAMWSLLVLLPLLIWGIVDVTQKRRAIVRNFPIIGRFRYVMEELRPKIYQYFIESDTNGTPINRISRSLVYQRSKKELDSTPFGTQLDVYRKGYEWLNHSIYPLNVEDLEKDPRVTVGNKACLQPYSCSVFNVSAMSFGSLSANAVEALNGGARKGNFAHNTGEGGISPYHLKHGGDLIWQIGTGYFGCRDKAGRFSEALFAEKAAIPAVKMIELKLSQGAKPGLGGILPGAKVTEEIAAIRNVEVGQSVISPPHHTAFSDNKGMLLFLKRMRDLSGGKPVGIKLCVGSKAEFHDLCHEMVRQDIYPDFISVDGGEGGTGAAPLEFSNHVGMPYKDGLAFVHNCLVGYDIKQHIILMSAGKITSAFDIFKTIALGADVCYSARAMMLALGCIQALECNKNTCPTGVATQDKSLMKGLNVVNKTDRVYNYHKETVYALVELLAAAGLKHPSEITRKHVYMRMTETTSKRYEDIYGRVKRGEYLASFIPA